MNVLNYSLYELATCIFSKSCACLNFLVNTTDHDYTDTEMDDRESVYYDTISVAGSEPNRKSLSLSRQTIYHSADDLPGYDPTPSRFATNNRNYSSILTPTKNSRNPKSNDINSTPYYSHIALAGGDYGDGGGVGGGGGRAMSECDEVSASLLDSYNRVNKKLPITYSQWKSRVTQIILYDHDFLVLPNYFILVLYLFFSISVCFEYL